MFLREQDTRSLALYSTVEEYYIDQRGISLLKRKLQKTRGHSLYSVVGISRLRVPTVSSARSRHSSAVRLPLQKHGQEGDVERTSCTMYALIKCNLLLRY